MDPFATSHFSNRALLHDLRTSVASERASTAVVLSRIAEADDRKLFLQEGYPSMYAFCLGELHYSEGAAYKRITAARVARQFPVLLVAVAEGRLHLSGVVMLSKYLRSGNADELLAAATHKTKAEIEQLIAGRFPRPDLPEGLRATASPSPVVTTGPLADPLSPGTVDSVTPPLGPLAPGPVMQLSPGTVEAPPPRPRLTPLAPERFGLQVTIDQETHDLLRQAQALMSHEIPTGELALVLKGVLKMAVAHLEKRKYAATTRPGHPRPCTSSRHIPAAVKRAVCERDGGRCTFVSDGGQRCRARSALEFDHREPVALGGQATPENLRLLCRAHNQHAAERALGVDFMERKRAEARNERQPR